jgi:hypothetical protein
MGSTHEDVDVFVDRCLDEKVDVAILDLNLELKLSAQQALSDTSSSGSSNQSETVFMLGSEVATLLRKRGFQGTAILYSANDESAIEPRHLECVDGYLEKTVWRTSHVKSVLVRAMLKRKIEQEEEEEEELLIRQQQQLSKKKVDG